MFDRYEFKAGDRVARADGAWAEVLTVSEDRTRLRVRYTGEGTDPPRAGTEGTIGVNEVASVSPASPGPQWAERVTVVVHRVPESEEFEGGYEAVTMTGTPEDVVVTGSNRDSAEDALNHLIAGLKTFGFSGRIAVDDATYIGGTQRYDVDVQ